MHKRQTAYDIHLYHGHGHLEKVYEFEMRQFAWSQDVARGKSTFLLAAVSAFFVFFAV